MSSSRIVRNGRSVRAVITAPSETCRVGMAFSVCGNSEVTVDGEERGLGWLGEPSGHAPDHEQKALSDKWLFTNENRWVRESHWRSSYERAGDEQTEADEAARAIEAQQRQPADVFLAA